MGKSFKGKEKDPEIPSVPPRPVPDGKWDMDEKGQRVYTAKCKYCMDEGYISAALERNGKAYPAIAPCPKCPIGMWLAKYAHAEAIGEFDRLVNSNEVTPLHPDVLREYGDKDEDRLIRKGIKALTKWEVPDDVDTETALKVGKEIFLGKRAVPAEDEPLDWRSE